VSGLFETIRVREGTIPFREAHLVRLRAGLETIGLPALPALIEERLADHARAGEAVLRLTADVGGPRIETRPVPQARPMRTDAAFSDCSSACCTVTFPMYRPS